MDSNATPKISVVMLTYNREKLVERAIESILAQTFTDYEFVVVDNGSTDDSGKIADKYAAKDKRIRVIHRAESGNIGSARNIGLDESKGEYIAFIDDDDRCEPDFLKFLYELANEYGAEISICGANDKIFDEKVLYSAEEALMTLFWRKRFNNQFPTKLIRAKLFENTRFSVNAKYDDIELCTQIIAKANCVAYHGVPLYTFERHENNNSAWTQNHKLLDRETLVEYLDVYRTRTEFLSDKFPNSAATWRYFEWSFMISMVEKVERLELCECKEIAERLKVALRENRDEFIMCEWILDFEREWVGKYL